MHITHTHTRTLTHVESGATACQGAPRPDDKTRRRRDAKASRRQSKCSSAVLVLFNTTAMLQQHQQTFPLPGRHRRTQCCTCAARVLHVCCTYQSLLTCGGLLVGMAHQTPSTSSSATMRAVSTRQTSGARACLRLCHGIFKMSHKLTKLCSSYRSLLYCSYFKCILQINTNSYNNQQPHIPPQET